MVFKKIGANIFNPLTLFFMSFAPVGNNQTPAKLNRSTEYFLFGLVWLKKFGCLVAVWLKFYSTNVHTSPSNLAQIGLLSGVKHTYRPVNTYIVVFKKIGDRLTA